MAWVRFTERFKWSPPELHNTWTQVFQPGAYNVTTPCAAAAIEAGKAVRVPPARKAGPKSADGAES